MGLMRKARTIKTRPPATDSEKSMGKASSSSSAAKSQHEGRKPDNELEKADDNGQEQDKGGGKKLQKNSKMTIHSFEVQGPLKGRHAERVSRQSGKGCALAVYTQPAPFLDAAKSKKFMRPGMILRPPGGQPAILRAVGALCVNAFFLSYHKVKPMGTRCRAKQRPPKRGAGQNRLLKRSLSRRQALPCRIWMPDAVQQGKALERWGEGAVQEGRTGTFLRTHRRAEKDAGPAGERRGSLAVRGSSVVQ